MLAKEYLADRERQEPNGAIPAVRGFSSVGNTARQRRRPITFFGTSGAYGTSYTSTSATPVVLATPLTWAV